MIIPIREANRTIGHHETFPLAALLTLQGHASTFVIDELELDNISYSHDYIRLNSNKSLPSINPS